MSPENLWAEFLMEVPLASTSHPADIQIDVDQKQQVIDGFGACFNELGWEALKILDSVQREDLLYRIFDQKDGCKFNIGRYLGPELKENELNTQIWYGTIERPYIENIDTALTDPQTKKYIAGVGFQWAGKGAIEKTQKKYPDMKLMQTESECGDGSNDWAAAMHTFDLIQHYFKYGANSYMYWNIVLDESGKSHWGWNQNSLVSINRKTKKITFNPEFYLIKLFSAHVQPGAVKLPVEPEENVLAFQNPDGDVVIILRNPADNTENKKVGLGQKVYQVSLDPNSITTLFIK